MYVCIACMYVCIAYVADPSRGRGNRDNSWLQFNGFIQQNQLRLSYTITKHMRIFSPQQVQLGHVFWHSLIASQYIYSQVLVSIIHPRTSPITFHVIHITFPYYKYVRSCLRAQARLNLRQSCFPSLARIMRDGRTNQRARLPRPGRISRWAHRSAAWFRCACQMSYFFTGIHAGPHVDHFTQVT